MIKNISLKEYHLSEGLSKSMMDKLSRSPAHLKHSLEEPEKETEAMVLGSAFHCLLLTPEQFEQEFAIYPGYDRRTSAGRMLWSKFSEENEGKYLLTPEQFEQVKKWADAVLQHPRAKILLTGKGSNEVSIYWNDSLTGEVCKARPDRIKDGVIIDLKTAVSAQPDDFQRKAYELGYHRQAYWFSTAYENEYGELPKSFLFIVVEKTAPYNVAIYEASDFFKEIGGQECDRLLQLYHHCKQTNDWYGYDGENRDIQPLELPNYIISKHMEEI